MTMREKMARAMAQCAAPGADPDGMASMMEPLTFPTPFGVARMLPPEEYHLTFWKMFLPAVDAALEALMEPTEGMIEAVRNKPFASGRVMYETVILAAKEGK